MTADDQQRLSEFLDRDTGPRACAAWLTRLERDPQLRATWARYHLIGDTIRGHAVAARHARIAASVAARIAAEAPPLKMPPAVLQAWPNDSWWRALPAVGVALAAVLALTAMAVLSPRLTGPEPAGHAPPSAGLPAGSRKAPPVATLATRDAPVSGRWELREPGIESKLDRMLVGHHESASAVGISGFVPYATLVGHDSSR